MKTAGFWISHTPNVDGVLMDEPQIGEFNRHLQKDLRLIQDITQLSNPYPGLNLKMSLETPLLSLSKRSLWKNDGQKVDSEFFHSLRVLMNLEAMASEVTLKYGIMTHYTNQRILPTDEPLLAQPFDVDFDELQNSSLEVGTPVRIMHETSDGVWVYGFSNRSAGWIKKSAVSFCDESTARQFLSPASFMVVTEPKADIFLDPAMTQYYDNLRMGARLPITMENPRTAVQVLLPGRDQSGMFELAVGYVPADDVHKGFLLYTPRTILRQAFKLLNEPYGWGGMYGEQDCSAFLVQVFSTVGLDLPRNSAEQARVGKIIAKFNQETTAQQKTNLLSREAIAGAALLPLKGHIMLYIGTLEGRPYAIHATWAYRESVSGKDRIRVINRVAVTDLMLGEGSKKGSLLERLTGVNILVP